MKRNEAIAILNQYIKKESLYKHMLAVESAMRFYANKFEEDAELWGNVGLLHDFDYEIHPDMPSHPTDGAPILRRSGCSGRDSPGRSPATLILLVSLEIT